MSYNRTHLPVTIKCVRRNVLKSNDPIYILVVSHFRHLFFILKIFDSSIFLCAVPLARFTSGLHSSFKCFCLNACAVSWIPFCYKYFAFDFAFFSAFFNSFLNKKLRNEWRCFCVCVNCCILWSVITCGVQNFLLIYMLPALVFAVICAIAVLRYFLQCFCALLV